MALGVPRASLYVLICTYNCAIQILVASSEGVDVDHFPSGGNPHRLSEYLFFLHRLTGRESFNEEP